MSGPDYIVDIAGMRQVGPDGSGVVSGEGSSDDGSGKGGSRPWLAIQWKCCSTYSRVYRNRSGTGYDGNCPKCGKPVRVKIGSGGTDNRFFEAS